MLPSRSQLLVPPRFCTVLSRCDAATLLSRHRDFAGGYHAGCDAWPYNDCTAFTATGVNPYSSAFASFFTMSSYPYSQPGSIPVMWGSGGMPGSDSSGLGSSYGGFGGGSVIITTDTLTLSGNIDVSGKAPASGCGYSSICGGGAFPFSLERVDCAVEACLFALSPPFLPTFCAPSSPGARLCRRRGRLHRCAHAPAATLHGPAEVGRRAGR